MLKISSIFLFGLLLLSPVATFSNDSSNQKDPNSCFGDIVSILSAGGYSGSVDCTSIQVDLKKVGAINIASNTYTVYDLRYRTIPSTGMVVHGGQRIIIILNGKTYLGQYSLSPPPMHKVTIKGNSIFIDVSAKNGNEIAIGKDGPPSSAFLDQDDADFYK